VVGHPRAATSNGAALQAEPRRPQLVRWQ
jgi:hypothetical protein